MNKVIHLSQTTSTNDYIKSVEQTHQIIVVTTQYQTKGRGQSGAWISDQGQNLLFSLKIQPRFMVTVEFIDWKMAPEPQSVVSFFSRMVSTAFTFGTVELSLPYSKPTSCVFR